MVRQLASGIYGYLPLGYRALRNVERIVREEMDAAGCQEALMPVLNPRDLWDVSGRWSRVGKAMIRFQDRAERDFCLALTHEEAFTQTVSAEVQSYRQLPLLIYHIQTKIRDEPRPRGGLLRVREFIMKDSYSFDADQAGLDVSYQKMLHAYERIFLRCGLQVSIVSASSGMMGGKVNHEFMMESDAGEDRLVLCDTCSYAANQEVARAADPPVPPGTPNPGVAQAVATPGVATIDALERFFDALPAAFLKTMVYWADGALVAAGVPGGVDVNLAKLGNAFGGPEDIRPASDHELRAAGLVPGFLGPPLPPHIALVVDPLVAENRGFIAGGNAPDTHRRDVVRGRDYIARVADLQAVAEGAMCSDCGGHLRLVKGLELGHIFQFGQQPYASAFNATFLDEHGESKLMYTGSYGIGMDRLVAAVVEAHHDDRGICWPVSVAPYTIFLVALNADRPEIAAAAEEAERTLEAAGLSVLYDDRTEGASAGVKFGDADLIGLPLRVTISPRTLAKGQAELKLRTSMDTEFVELPGLVVRAQELLNAMAPM